MERIWLPILTIAVALATGASVVQADTVMMRTPAAPAAERAQKQEVYPASEFGKAPERKRFPMGSDPFTAASESSAWPAAEPVMGAGRGRPDVLEAGRTPASAEPPPGESTASPRAINAVNPPPGMEAQAMRRKGVQEIAVIAGDSGFFPRTLFVTRDIPVRLYVTGASKNTLCMMMDSFQVRKQIRSQKIEEISFTPGVPGKYRFHCPVNGMEGNLIVRELAAVETE